MKRTAGLRKVSAKQAKENALRVVVKAQCLQRSKGLCECGCKERPTWQGFDLVHIKSRAQGGRTDMQNCQVWKREHHNGPEGHQTEMPPGWAAGKIEGKE